MKGRVVGMHLGELVAGEDLRTALSGSLWRTVATTSPAEPVASSRAPATKTCSAFRTAARLSMHWRRGSASRGAACSERAPGLNPPPPEGTAHEEKEAAQSAVYLTALFLRDLI